MERAREALAAARLLRSNGCLSDAVSRAYYVMFYVAEALLLGDGLKFKSHAGVIGAFGRRFAKSGRVPREFHRYLLDAADERFEGDYGGIYRPDTETVDTLIGQAGEFIALGERMLAG